MSAELDAILARIPDPRHMPTHRPAPLNTAPDPQLSNSYWMRRCGRHGCPTPVPRHLAVCRQHETGDSA